MNDEDYSFLMINITSPIAAFQRRQWHPTPVLLPGKSHGWRSLVGCSPWGRWESDTTERLPFHFSFSSIGEGNGNPLQCFCLENTKDGGACWAAIYGGAQSWTWLKWLSSSSSWFFSQGLGPRVFLTQLLSDISLKTFSVAPNPSHPYFIFYLFISCYFPFSVLCQGL